MIRSRRSMSRTVRRLLLMAACAAAAACGTRSAAAVDAPPDDAVRSSSGRDHGFYLGLGFVREYLRLSLDERAILPETGIESDEWGSGGSFTIGYGVSPRFRGEMSLGGVGHPARPDGAQAGSAAARFTGYVPLWTGGSWEPHLIGGFSATAAFFQAKGEKELAYFGASGDAGIGLRVHPGRHWALQADFLHVVIDIDQEITDRPGDASDMKDVGNRGRAEVIRFGCTYDF